MAGVVAAFKALSNPNRLRVFQAVCRGAARAKAGPTIEQICSTLKMKQPAVSHHVARLADAGLIERTKDRWWVHCAPSAEGLALIARFARDPGGFEADG
jgi:DNA-binding transcriptional ArsR family regulator